MRWIKAEFLKQGKNQNFSYDFITLGKYITKLMRWIALAEAE